MSSGDSDFTAGNLLDVNFSFSDIFAMGGSVDDYVLSSSLSGSQVCDSVSSLLNDHIDERLAGVLDAPCLQDLLIDVDREILDSSPPQSSAEYSADSVAIQTVCSEYNSAITQVQLSLPLQQASSDAGRLTPTSAPRPLDSCSPKKWKRKTAATCSALTAPIIETRPTKKQAVDEQEYNRSKAHNGLGVEQNYNCGYCDRLKTSASLCADGRVRIRCACGGQRQDGVPRMHANWKPITGSMILPIDVQCIKQVEGIATAQLSITAPEAAVSVTAVTAGC